uniref:Amino acid adenylation domain-containing protein n=1 Tax=Candidatus Kentrum sp. TUN TaxID=2126343 RepID=A0A451AP90_9GAMM|nr:MAG: amino acid adenylation domain-containing protein [Candidatus Kentron sp. TUN]VFK67850.1 MAG: amino acid adenylation domain-containing protein [Candidatus Kentron sp. TUN]
MIEITQSLYGAFKYNTDLFEDETIERMVGHFQCLLEGIIAEPKTRISQLPLLTESERQRILVEWNDTKAPYPQDKCVHELFEEQVAISPDAISMVFPSTDEGQDEEVSYEELNDRANRLAHRLRALGVGPEVLVGLFIEHSMEMVAGLLAILKAGGAYVPLDPDYPPERLAFMAEDADLKVLLCHGATRERLPECAARILELDAEAEVIAEEDSDNLGQLAGPDNLAYVIYTSGSTGKPKGVMVENGGLTNLAYMQTCAFRIKLEDKVLQFASFNFDASLEQMFSAFLGGAKLVLRGREIWTVEECWHQAQRHNLTVAEFTPIYLHQFLEFCLENGGLPDHLRQLVTGGDVLSEATVALSRQLGIPLLDTYGPTEATITTTNFPLPDNEEVTASTTSIGRPIANARVYILDQTSIPHLSVLVENCTSAARV